MVRINLRRMRQLMRETHKLLWKLEKAQAYATRSSAPLSELPWGRGNRSRVEEGAIRISELLEAYEEAFLEAREWYIYPIDEEKAKGKSTEELGKIASEWGSDWFIKEYCGEVI